MQVINEYLSKQVTWFLSIKYDQLYGVKLLREEVRICELSQCLAYGKEERSGVWSACVFVKSLINPSSASCTLHLAGGVLSKSVREQLSLVDFCQSNLKYNYILP